MLSSLTSAICSPRFLPTMLALIDLAAAARYAYARSLPDTLYWLFAAGLTGVVAWRDVLERVTQ